MLYQLLLLIMMILCFVSVDHIVADFWIFNDTYVYAIAVAVFHSG